ncbi:hypothetical protein GOBAR_AA36150 [Gossypium barbadense]|uniref:Uncharacterized protein n=1 Tax=Gossypium barbadense TaxID=3634 RepID=A0A2P5W0E2_GOSBA|nr:hypothetical protein GOBAR_AA36150 [Gossypium barbadense]
MTKDRTEEQFGDDAVTLQARNSVKTSNTQDNAIKPIDDKTNIQSSLQELPRTKTTETVRYYHEENKDVHEERRLWIEELDECIFPFDTVEVSHPKFSTFKHTRPGTQACLRPWPSMGRDTAVRYGRVEAGHDFPKTRDAINPHGRATGPWANLIGEHGRGNKTTRCLVE